MQNDESGEGSRINERQLGWPVFSLFYIHHSAFCIPPMKSLAAIIASPVLCLAVLGGVVLENRRHTRPEDAAPFHARAKAALDAWPQAVSNKATGEDWTSRETKIPDAAIQL